jgi:hypothetical protein
MPTTMTDRPAFAGYRAGETFQEGLTIREYFAARAPHDIPPWFTPTLAPMPKAPPVGIDLTAYVLSRDEVDMVVFLVDGWRRDPCFDLATYAYTDRPDRTAVLDRIRPALAQYEAVWNGYREAHVAWHDESQRQRVAQWPWAWADLVLAEPRS